MLVDEIKKRMFAAMKSGDAVEKEILRVALGEIQTIEARVGKSSSDDDVAAVVRKLLKSDQETLDACDGEEQKRVLSQEIAVLESLLPKTLDVDAIVNALEPIRDELRAAGNDGQATGVAMKHLKSQGASVTGKDVASAVRKLRSA